MFLAPTSFVRPILLNCLSNVSKKDYQRQKTLGLFFQKLTVLTVYNLLCSSWRPLHFNLLASCWAFFLSLQALEANLFFSLRLLQRAPKGISLTGVKSLIILLNCSNSLPIAANFLGLAVRSLPSPRRAFPLKSKKRYVQLVI